MIKTLLTGMLNQKSNKLTCALSSLSDETLNQGPSREHGGLILEHQTESRGPRFSTHTWCRVVSMSKIPKLPRVLVNTKEAVAGLGSITLQCNRLNYRLLCPKM